MHCLDAQVECEDARGQAHSLQMQVADHRRECHAVDKTECTGDPAFPPWKNGTQGVDRGNQDRGRDCYLHRLDGHRYKARGTQQQRQRMANRKGLDNGKQAPYQVTGAGKFAPPFAVTPLRGRQQKRQQEEQVVGPFRNMRHT